MALFEPGDGLVTHACVDFGVSAALETTPGHDGASQSQHQPGATAAFDAAAHMRRVSIQQQANSSAAKSAAAGKAAPEVAAGGGKRMSAAEYRAARRAGKIVPSTVSWGSVLYLLWSGVRIIKNVECLLGTRRRGGWCKSVTHEDKPARCCQGCTPLEAATFPLHLLSFCSACPAAAAAADAVAGRKQEGWRRRRRQWRRRWRLGRRRQRARRRLGLRPPAPDFQQRGVRSTLPRPFHLRRHTLLDGAGGGFHQCRHGIKCYPTLRSLLVRRWRWATSSDTETPSTHLPGEQLWHPTLHVLRRRFLC